MRRVDNIPWYWQPFFQAFGWILGIGLYLYSCFIHATCTIWFTGEPLPSGTGAVYCIWHKDLALYFAVFTRVKKQSWMSHPAWFMKPIQIMKRLTGIEHIYLGSSGNSGKEALASVIADLRQGYSTTVACDGPAGPPEVLKPGVLYMSRDSGLPVIALHFSCTRYIRFGGWDKKRWPFPFSTIVVSAGKPEYISSANEAAATKKIEDFLNTAS